MNGFFNMDSPFSRVLGKIADLIILNLLCIVCCIPVITIGPSLTALFYVTLKLVRNEEGYIVRGFFKSFRQNLRQGIIINLIMLLLAFFFWLDIRVLNMLEKPNQVIFFLILFAMLIYMMVFVYIYPVLAKFDNTIKNTFQNALMMSLSHLPYTLAMILVTIAPILLIFFTRIAQVQSILLMLFFMMGVALIAYSNSYFLVKIFDKYIPQEEKAPVDPDAISADETVFSAELSDPFPAQNIPEASSDQTDDLP